MKKLTPKSCGHNSVPLDHFQSYRIILRSVDTIVYPHTNQYPTLYIYIYYHRFLYLLQCLSNQENKGRTSLAVAAGTIKVNKSCIDTLWLSQSLVSLSWSKHSAQNPWCFCFGVLCLRAALTGSIQQSMMQSSIITMFQQGNHLQTLDVWCLPLRYVWKWGTPGTPWFSPKIP